MAALDLRMHSASAVLQERLTLGMMHLSPFGLSEQWLLRHLGDLHWALIARAAGVKDTSFRDAAGKPVYAAFCATSLTLSASDAKLGTTVKVCSQLQQVTPSRLGSIHEIYNDRKRLARLEMISCFLSHDESGCNRSLMRNRLPGLAPLPVAGPGLTALHGRAQQSARTLREPFRRQTILTMTPSIALDFNAVGLLYFPSFSRIAEMACPSDRELSHREVVYTGNLNPGEDVCVEQSGHGLVLRGPAGPIALVRTKLVDRCPNGASRPEITR